MVVRRAPGCQIDAVGVHEDDRGFVPKAEPPCGISAVEGGKVMKVRLQRGLLPVLLLSGALLALGCGGGDDDPEAVCGNGVIEAGEQCDGVNLNEQTCVTKGFGGGTLSCTANCKFDTSGCTDAPADCGNGVIDAGEQCDGTNLNEQTCESQGFDGGTLSCTTTCQFNTTGCTKLPPECGNGEIDGDEQCDGANLNEQSCETQGFDGGTLSCTAACQFDTTGCTTIESDCGNGVIEAGEQCEGANLNGQNCKRQGFDEGTLSCTADCQFDTSACITITKVGVGEPCTRDIECESDLCLTEVIQGFPSGYCAAPCNGDGSCDDANAICVDVGEYLCLRSCAPGGSDCRDAYNCEDLGEGAGACWPACTGDPQCPDTGTCNDRGFCETQCTDDTDCPAGMACGSEGLCELIDDCATKGCNDPDGSLYCNEASGYCLEDACLDNPCDGLANATGECERYFDEYRCYCNEDYIWDGDADACVAFECSAIDLGTLDGTLIEQAGDTCNGTSLYNAGGSGVSSCTRYTSEDKELVYKLTVPAGVAVEVHMEPTDFDASLWVTTSCDDVLGLKCVVGADDPETVVVHNDTTEDQTYYIIADAYEDCGAFTLTISSLGKCGNGVKEGHEQCDGLDFGGASCSNFGFAEGTLTCSAQCKLDFTNCNYGSLQPVGGPCTTGADCASGLCWDELNKGLPSGYCVDKCTEERDCWDPANICVSAGGNRLCAKKCTPGVSGECRDAYACVDLGEGDGACWAKCTTDSQCSVAGRCNLDSGFCSCPLGQHVEAGACVYDDCKYLGCANLNRNCDPVGGCSGSCAVCTDCVPGTQESSGDYCRRIGTVWGGPCEVDADCPGSGTPGEDTYCDNSGTGGFCMQFDGPDHVGDGQPCTGDPNSVGVSMAYVFWIVPVCLQGCEIDADCRAGYTCSTDIDHNNTVLACSPITECGTDGCNDDGSLRCASDGKCWVDSCAPNPCTSTANSTKACVNVRDSYTCECVDDHRWDDESMSCVSFECTAQDLGTVTAEIQLTGEDSCTGTSEYNADGTGESCTNYHTKGNEKVYKITLPAGASVYIEMVPVVDFDASLWVTTACNDFSGAKCVEGADDPEEVTITNEGSAPATYYIVADAFSGCGTFNLTITPK